MGRGERTERYSGKFVPLFVSLFQDGGGKASSMVASLVPQKYKAKPSPTSIRDLSAMNRTSTPSPPPR